MADPMGLYDSLLNSIYSNAPAYMREEAVYDVIKIYDQIWNPILQEIFPRTPAPSVGGKTVSVEDEFVIPNTTDLQYMSQMMDRSERTTPRAVGFEKEVMQARLTKEWGPVTDPFEFENEFKAGFLAKRNQLLTQGAVKAIERRVEYELVGYSHGTQSTIERYGNQWTQSISRLKKFDASETVSSESDYLSGNSWDDAANSKPMYDLQKIELHANEMAGESIKRGFIGASTAFSLEQNNGLKELLKYHYDLTATPLATSLGGITFTKVIGQTYKDDSTNSARVGYPGMGDVRKDNWTTRRKIKMMVDSDGDEWGIFVPGPIGNLFTARTNPKQTNTDVPYGHTWDDAELEYVYSNVQFGFCPHVDDFARLIIVDKLSKALV
ncbi:MAG: hypothetical protein ACTSRU_19065 [Candidatus Hodarchaeales archaeon]